MWNVGCGVELLKHYVFIKERIEEVQVHASRIQDGLEIRLAWLVGFEFPEVVLELNIRKDSSYLMPFSVTGGKSTRLLFVNVYSALKKQIGHTALVYWSTFELENFAV